ncbi:FAD-dependent oxidoreductase [Geodermatophilus maliterrae]|uniref:FAD-dependent oxidoreductase n=1 Tax=Geodermatophilus maliterrae TaxID=3162531 RepID=A0ABV3XJ50_9ACTN
MEHAAVVVGAGVAGLASAISLARTGWQVTVLERSPELGEVGAGLAMTPNAVAAFRGLGFGDDDVAALGYPTWAGGIRDLAGRPVLTLPDTPVMRRSVGLIGVHRRRLHAALHRRALACGVGIVTGTPVATVDPGEPEGAPAVVEGREADIVVGADGVRSAVRAVLFPASHPVYSGYSSWRGIAHGASGYTALQQYWGPHAEFGTVRVADDETYWYGYVAMPERTVIGDELGAARERFAGWASPVQEVMAVTPPEAVLRHDVHHLPGGLPRYTTGRVVMVGDAAHGTLPTMG